MTTTKPPPKMVIVDLPGGPVTVEMSLTDFHTLNRMADNAGKLEILHAKKEFREMSAKGLVKAQYVARGDWTVAVVALTELGRLVLQQEFKR